MGYVFVGKNGDYVGKAFALSEMLKDDLPGYFISVRAELETTGEYVISVAYISDDDRAGNLFFDANENIEKMAERVYSHAAAGAGMAL